jgi:tight adherence protein C
MTELAATIGQVSWELMAACGAVMVAVVAAAAGVRALVAPRPDEVIERLERTVGRAAADRHDVSASAASTFARILRPITWVARPTKVAELSRLRAKLVQAGLRGAMAMEIFLAAKLLLGVLAALVFLQINARLTNPLASPLDLGIAIWVCGVGLLLPNVWLSGRVRARQLLIEKSLPDAMDLLVTCVEAGLGIDAALSRVAEEIGYASPVLGQELNQTFLEVQAGVTRADAFRRLAERTGVEDLRSLSAMLIQTEMFGTSVARALRVHSDGMRTKRMQRAEEKAAMVGVKMTIPLVLCILPCLLAVLLGPAVVSIAQSFFGQNP